MRHLCWPHVLQEQSSPFSLSTRKSVGTAQRVSADVQMLHPGKGKQQGKEVGAGYPVLSVPQGAVGAGCWWWERSALAPSSAAIADALPLAPLPGLDSTTKYKLLLSTVSPDIIDPTHCLSSLSLTLLPGT